MDAESMSGLELLQAMAAGKLPGPPMAKVLDFGLAEVSAGHVVFSGTPTREHYNPNGTVHGGYAATLLDSCAACAVVSSLAPGVDYTTIELKINYVRAMTEETGVVRAVGTLIHSGRRTAIAEGRLIDAKDRLMAHCTTTCLILS